MLLIDASTIGEGRLGRNSGFLINLPHNTGMSGHGSPVEVARKQIKLYNTGIDWLKSLVDQHGIDCGWNPVGKYHAAATPDGEKAGLRETLRQYEQWGVAYRELGADQLQAALGTRYYHYGYHSHNNIFVQPAALVWAWPITCRPTCSCGKASRAGAVARPPPVRKCTRSATLMADRVVIANNGFATRLGLARDRVSTITPTRP